jgi:predicted nuclease of restriction endonuclease-like (RecB) superfamily
LADVRELIEAARQHVAQAVNSTLVTLYWHVGHRIRQEVVGEGRAAYGEEIVYSLSTQLAAEYGRGFNRPNLFRMIRFAEVFPDENIVSALRRQLSWTHFRELIAFDDPLKRDFYAEMCRIERWSTRTLHAKIQGMLYERTAISKKPEETIRRDLDALLEEDRLTPDLVFRDPYVLDFLGLKDSYGERDMEQAILRELEAFLLELGSDFAFVARQKRISVDHSANCTMPFGWPESNWPGERTCRRPRPDLHHHRRNLENRRRSPRDNSSFGFRHSFVIRHSRFIISPTPNP